MADHEFETRLHRLFGEAPAFPDAPLFAARVDGRLDRGWTARKLLIGGAGVVGGGFAVAQLLTANFGARLREISNDSLNAAQNGLAHLPGAAELTNLRALPFSGEAVWLVLGLAVLAGALLATRSVEEL
jgi:hypothetical protein